MDDISNQNTHNFYTRNTISNDNDKRGAVFHPKYYEFDPIYNALDLFGEELLIQSCHGSIWSQKSGHDSSERPARCR